MRKKLSNHHCYPRRLGGIKHKDNMVKLQYKKHMYLHHLLDKNNTANPPIEQMQELFSIISKPIVDDVKDEINYILELAKQSGIDIYKNGIIKKVNFY